MSSTALEFAAAQWLAQVASMKAALAELKLPVSPSRPDTLASEEDEGEDYASRPGSGGGADVWDFISDGELEELGLDSGYLTEATDGPDGSDGPDALPSFGPHWFAVKCSEVASRKPGGLPSATLQDRIVDVLRSSRPEDELQSQLTDLVGLDDLDLVIELLAHRKEIVAFATPSSADDAASALGPGPGPGPGVRLLTKAQREEELRQRDFRHKTATLAAAASREPEYPHVYRAHSAGNALSFAGKRYALPEGSERKEFEKYEEYLIPARKPGAVAPGQALIQISHLDGLCRETFKGYKTLNRMQSLVYPVAYKTSENMLVCAPTGAGKTDAAMLTILHTIGQYATPNPASRPEAADFAVDTDGFKIIYVAPMKALAAEITDKLGRRLAWLGIRCREYTGDMHLTKAEIVQTQVLVTTPEKWDVVTRRGTGDTELVQKVRLLIVDEVHMLHDERGAVLESLVARTQRQVESSQSLIRIVGLSATLPNFVDVADFLKVNRRVGMFYFDASFRPVPLEQHFVGVKGKPGTKVSRDNLDTVAFDKVREMLEKDKQVMVFVHSRRDTLASAKMLYDKATEQACADLLDPVGHPGYEAALSAMRSSKARELRDLVPKGLGIHHAGMARSDRNLMERLFGEGVVKVLCCTATLAWGVNLPAAAVVIKGTQVYSAQEGRFVDLGILDVLQIFGRAGRPQFEDTGVGVICTTADRLGHYLTAVTDQLPIESRFSAKLVDNLNAEVALGTVTSVAEAVQWLGYSYLFVRMRRNPMAYGIDWGRVRRRPGPGRPPPPPGRRRRPHPARQPDGGLHEGTTDELRSTNVGRIASQFYVQHETIQLFNARMRPAATEADVLKTLAASAEFANVQSRDSEAAELTRLRDGDAGAVPCEVEGGVDTREAKTNILLQAFVSRAQPDDFALANDLNYVAQQAARLCRALFMMVLNRRWGHQCLVVLTLAKSSSAACGPSSTRCASSSRHRCRRPCCACSSRWPTRPRRGAPRCRRCATPTRPRSARWCATARPARASRACSTPSPRSPSRPTWRR